MRTRRYSVDLGARGGCFVRTHSITWLTLSLLVVSGRFILPSTWAVALQLVRSQNVQFINSEGPRRYTDDTVNVGKHASLIN